MTLGIQVHLYLGMSIFNSVMGCMPVVLPMVYELTKVYTNDTRH